MKKFRVDGAEITKSRCGQYVYRLPEIIEAETEEEVKAIYKAKHKAPAGKRWQVRIFSVKEIVK